MDTLKQGLTDGAVTISDLKQQFGDNITGLFPKDLSKLGKTDIATLKEGLKSGDITDAQLKSRYDKQYAAILSKIYLSWVRAIFNHSN